MLTLSKYLSLVTVGVLVRELSTTTRLDRTGIRINEQKVSTFTITGEPPLFFHPLVYPSDLHLLMHLHAHSFSISTSNYDRGSETSLCTKQIDV